MNIGRTPGSPLPPLPASSAATDPSATPGAANTAARSAGGNAGSDALSTLGQVRHAHHAHYKGRLFEQNGHSTSMRRGLTPRSPLRGPAGKRGPGRAKLAAGGAIDEAEIEAPDETHVPDEMRSQQIRIQAQSEQEGSGDESNQGRAEEKRFERITQRRPASDDDAVSALPDLQRKDPAAVRRAQRSVLPPLPEMHSLEDVMRVIHAATRPEAAGESRTVLLKRIAEAVMLNEIKLPHVTLISEARAALIDAFGTGHDGRTPLSEPLQSVLTLLPLWLINMSKRRTAVERSLAAARLALDVSASHTVSASLPRLPL